MLNAVKILFALTIVLMVASSCDKDKNYPDTPFLEFRSSERLPGDSIMVTSYFRDGNGDIGSDGLPPYTDDNCDARDVVGYYEEWIDGEWVLNESINTLFWCVPSMTPVGQDKTLEGEVIYRSEIELNTMAGAPDTVRFGMQLIDRAGQESNIVYTEAVVLD